jgi:ABC-2 type transport system permease protein
MHNVITVARRELAAYFYSPIAYIVVVIFLLISGYMFFTEMAIGTPQAEMRPFFGLAPLMFCFFAPLITMGLFSKERASGTLEMLLALPVTDWQVVIGKFLAAVGLVATILAFTFPYAAFLHHYSAGLDWGPVIGGYLGLLLMASGYLAVGVMTSVWTKEQITAAVVAFLIGFALFLSGKLLQVLPQSVAPVVQAIAFDFHFQNIARGVVDFRDLLYYGSLIGICLLVAQTSLESRRWR